MVLELMGLASKRLGDGFEKAVTELAQLCGWAVAGFRTVKVHGKRGPYFITPVQADGAGWPDMVLVRGSTILFRELKAGSGRVRKNQREWLERLEVANCDVGVWRDDPAGWRQVEEDLAR